ncbi:DUF6093 family protein [Myceligenerans halotolerans]
MTAVSTIRAGRRAAEKLMVDTCTVHRIGDPVTDPDTGEVTPSKTLLYTGRCKVQTYEAQEFNPEVAEAIRAVQRYTVHVPVASFAPEVGDVVEITAATLDAQLTGRRYRVAALLHKSMATAYRLGVEEEV